jgi:GTPase SAR1 family protein
MRKRSPALHAESEDEYKEKLQIITEEQEKTKSRTIVSAYTPVTRFSAKEIIELHEKLKKEKPQAGFEFFCSDEQEAFQKNSNFKRRPSVKSPEMSEGRGSVEAVLEDNSLTISNERKNDCMIIGGSKVGKHFLTNSCFEDAHQDHQKESTFDMLIKSRACSDFNNKYHFWIHQISNASFDNIVKTYYKKIGLFIFVFDFGSRDSFSMLCDAIHKVRKEVPSDKFKAILIGNQTDFTSSKTVSTEEIENLQIQHCISEYLEVGFGNSFHYQNVLSKIDQYLFS